jgi:diguanylate cyclase (GGDEF)-like protein
MIHTTEKSATVCDSEEQRVCYLGFDLTNSASHRSVWDRKPMQQILIESLMSTKIHCAAPATPLSAIVQDMRAHRHSCVLITEADKPVGIITERDIVKHFSDLLQQARDYDPAAASLMSSPPVTVEAKTTLFEALVIAGSHGIRHLPVTDSDGKLLGLATHTDLVAAHFRIIQSQTEVLEQAVAQRTEELLEVNNRLRELALEDGLLKIGNRRAMEVDLAHTDAAARRYHRPYAVILADVDHFKLYNDHYGHAAGDKALQEIAAIMKQSIRKSDRVYRYGGEELLLVLPETDRSGAENLGQKLLKAVTQRAIEHTGHTAGTVTLSGGIGCSDLSDATESWHELLQRADRALYQAKNAGRNRIV